MLSEIALQAMLRDGIYVSAASVLYAMLIWFNISRVLGFPYATIRGRIDGDPKAMAAVFASIALGLAYIIGSVIR